MMKPAPVVVETAPAARSPFCASAHPCNLYPEKVEKTPHGDGEPSDDNGQGNVYRSELYLTVTANMMDKNPEGFGDFSIGHNTSTALYVKVLSFVLAAVQRMNENRPKSVRVFVEALVVNPFEQEKLYLRRIVPGDESMDMPQLDGLTASLLYDPNNVIGYRFRFVILGRSSSASNILRRQLFENQLYAGILNQRQKEEKMLLLHPEDSRDEAIERVALQRVMIKKSCSEEKALDDHDSDIKSEAKKMKKSLEKQRSVGLLTSEKDKVRPENDLRFYFRSAVCNEDWIRLARVLYMISGQECSDSSTMGLTAEEMRDESFPFSSKKEISPEFCMSFLNSVKTIRDPTNSPKDCNYVQMTKNYYISGDTLRLSFPFPYLVWEISDCSLYALSRNTFPWHRRPLHDRLGKDEKIVAAHQAQLKREKKKKEQKQVAQLKPQSMMKNRNRMTQRAVPHSSSSSSASAMDVDDMDEFNKFLDAEREENAKPENALFAKENLITAEDQRRFNAEDNRELLSLRISTQKDLGPMTTTTVDSQLSDMANKNNRTLVRILTVCCDFPYKQGDLLLSPTSDSFFCSMQDKLHEYMSLHRQEVTFSLIGMIKMGGPRVAQLHTNAMHEYQRLSYGPIGTFSFVRPMSSPQPNLTLFSNYRLHRIQTFSSMGMANPMIWVLVFNVYLSIMREREVRLPFHAGVIGEAGQNKSYAAGYMNKTMPSGSVQSVDTASAKADATSSWEGNTVRYHDEDGKRLMTETQEVLNKADESRSMMKTLMASNRIAHRINAEEVDPVTGKSRRVTAQCDTQKVTGTLTMGNTARIDRDVEESVGDRQSLNYLVPTKQDVQSSVATRVMGVDSQTSSRRYRENVENDLKDNVIKTFIFAMMDAGSIPQVNLTVFHVVFQKFLEEIRPYLPCAERKARMAIRAETTAFLDTVNLVHYTYFLSEASPWRSRDPTVVEPPSLEQLPCLLSPSMYCPLDVALSSITLYMEELFPLRWAQILRFATSRMCNFYSDFFETAYKTCPVQLRPNVAGRAVLRGQKEVPKFLERWYEFASSCDAYVYSHCKTDGNRKPMPRMPRERKPQKKTGVPVSRMEEQEGGVRNYKTVIADAAEKKGYEKSEVYENAKDATELFNPNFVQFEGSLLQFAEMLVNTSGEVFSMDPEVVMSLLTRMRKRTVRIPLMDPCVSTGKGIHFGLHGTDGSISQIKRVEYMTVRCIDELIDTKADNNSRKVVRIPVHLLMCPTPELLYMGLTASECRTTRELEMVLPIDVMGHDDMCETWKTHKTSHPLCVTNPSADQAGSIERFFSGMDSETQDEEDEGEKDGMTRAGSTTDFYRFSKVFKGPTMVFERDLEELVYREHILANALHPSFDTLTLEEEKGDKEEEMETTLRPTITPKEKKRALEVYVNDDLARPGNMDNLIVSLWKESHPELYKKKEATCYPDSLIVDVNMQHTLSEVGALMDKRTVKALNEDEKQTLKIQRQFIKRVNNNDNFVHPFRGSELVTPNTSRWSAMKKQGWKFEPALEKDLFGTPEIYGKGCLKGRDLFVLTNVAHIKSKAHIDMCAQFDQVDIKITKFKYLRYLYGIEAMSRTVQRLYTDEKEDQEKVDNEVQKAKTAKKKNVYKHMIDFDTLEKQKQAVERVLSAWNRAENEAEMMTFQVYGVLSSYWSNKIDERVVLMNNRPVDEQEVARKRKEEEALDATYVGGPDDTLEHRDKRAKGKEEEEVLDSDDEDLFRKRPSVRTTKMF